MLRVDLLGFDTDEDLARRACIGEREAERVLVQRLYPGVHTLALRLVRNVENARDATQETFLRALRRIEQYDGIHRFSAWIFRILINFIRDEHRRRGRMISMELAPDDWPAQEPFPVDVAIRQESFQQIRIQVERLPDDLRAALLLHFQEGLTGRETAYALGITYDAARLRISRAVAKLREWLREAR